ncbi:MAG: hypothetical protein ACLQD8_04800 [Thermoplasmata archaeon]
MAAGDGPPRVELPERLDRKLRLGPFPSGRDALKFVTYAAVGALLVPFLGVAVWIPFVLAGLVVSIWRPEGEAVDERVSRYVRWRWGGLRRSRPMTAPRPPAPGRRSIVRLPTSFAAVVRTGGLPLAYLPPSELARRFEQYRDLLRASEGTFLLHSTRAPIHPIPFLPAEPAPAGAEGTARAGYRELVEVIVRRRFVRHVFFALATRDLGPEGIQRLETELASLIERLRALGLRPLRLRDQALRDAVRRLGLAEEKAGR